MHPRHFFYPTTSSTFANLIRNQTRVFTSDAPCNRVSLYLQRSRLIDSFRLGLRSKSPAALLTLLKNPSLDSFVVTHALRSAPSPDLALSLVETLNSLPNFTHTQTTLHAIAKILAKSGRSVELQSLIDDINAGKFTNVARISYMDRLRWHAAAADLDSAVRVWNEFKLALPGGKKHPCTESYNLLMSLYAQKGKHLEAVQMFSRMISEGANPNSRTYTVMIEHLANSGKLDSAEEVFKRLPSMRVKRTSRQYSVLAQSFILVKRFDEVKELLKEMRMDGILPGRTMQLSLKCMQDAGYLEETEEFIRELSPDERIGRVGFYMDDSDNDEDGDDDDNSGEADGDGIQLKPWLDPSALASALSDWKPGEVSALEAANFVWTTRLVCKILRNFKRVETAWHFFCWVACQPENFTHDVYTVSRMITILARHGHVELVDQLISKVKREGIRLPFSTVRLIIDFYGISKKADAALKVFRNAELVCGSLSKFKLMLLYSSLLWTLTKCLRSSEAMDLLEEMILSGTLPDIQTFCGLMQYFALEGDLRTVHRLFGMVRQSGLELDAYMFQILIRAYCKCEKAAIALRVFEDMRSLNLMPDVFTKALLVKSLWREGKLREAALVEERSEEINDILPSALPGHVWTVSSADLTKVYNLYSDAFAKNGD
ncbi:PREDICTED: pentatricopeptide repeat-containing protein At5g66631 [Nelumbo nucifera]|uniref:Pentatricopeptide repeat-containing protein At5g66631 n=1 Tax=Nelumbo nucifera TaxID=4432 RepID=A0A1U7ZLQ3_NELNU|nr:PREDICTED: pentatricopeptide repeat-containing protein At5g66631 [Nelumbo nucifera]XP_010254979.1 PREDICTED: pentatricopeptide repeat-containing protein At5g66631 [Nelumbo nucifera]